MGYKQELRLSLGPTGPLSLFELGYVHHGRPTSVVAAAPGIPQIHKRYPRFQGFRRFQTAYPTRRYPHNCSCGSGVDDEFGAFLDVEKNNRSIVGCEYSCDKRIPQWPYRRYK